MPKPSAVNRDLVKALFIKGLPASEIAPQFGISPNQVRVWATRGKWIQERTANEVLKPLVLQDVASEFSNMTITIARSLLLKLQEFRMGNVREVKDAASALSNASATARRWLGLDDDRVSRHLHVHVMRDAALVADAGPGAQPVIDVGSEVQSVVSGAQNVSVCPTNEGSSLEVVDGQGE